MSRHSSAGGGFIPPPFFCSVDPAGHSACRSPLVPRAERGWLRLLSLQHASVLSKGLLGDFRLDPGRKDARKGSWNRVTRVPAYSSTPEFMRPSAGLEVASRW